MGVLCRGQGDRQKAYQLLTEANDTYQEIGELSLGIWIMQDLTWAIWDRGRIQLAYNKMKDYVTAHRKLRSRLNISTGLSQLASMALYTGDYVAAQQYIDELLGIQTLLNIKEQRWGMLDQASLDFWVGRLEQAHDKFKHIHSIFRDERNIWGISTCLNFLGIIEVLNGDLQDGVRLLEESRSLCDSMPDPGIQVRVDNLMFIGYAACQQKEFQSSQILLQSSLRQVSSDGRLPSIPIRMELLAETFANMHEYRSGAVLMGAAHHQREVMSLPVLPVNLPANKRTLQMLEGALGEQTFAEAWKEGETMTVVEGVAFALREK